MTVKILSKLGGTLKRSSEMLADRPKDIFSKKVIVINYVIGGMLHMLRGMDAPGSGNSFFREGRRQSSRILLA